MNECRRVCGVCHTTPDKATCVNFELAQFTVQFPSQMSSPSVLVFRQKKKLLKIDRFDIFIYFFFKKTVSRQSLFGHRRAHRPIPRIALYQCNLEFSIHINLVDEDFGFEKGKPALHSSKPKRYGMIQFWIEPAHNHYMSCPLDGSTGPRA
jgi:hypothetical protein